MCVYTGISPVVSRCAPVCTRHILVRSTKYFTHTHTHTYTHACTHTQYEYVRVYRHFHSHVTEDQKKQKREEEKREEEVVPLFASICIYLHLFASICIYLHPAHPCSLHCIFYTHVHTHIHTCMHTHTKNMCVYRHFPSLQTLCHIPIFI